MTADRDDELDEDFHRLLVVNDHGVLPPPLPIEHSTTAARPGLHLERRPVDVNRVRAIPIRHEHPPLHVAKRYREFHGGDIIRLAVDPGHPVEREPPGPHRTA